MSLLGNEHLRAHYLEYPDTISGIPRRRTYYHWVERKWVTEVLVDIGRSGVIVSDPNELIVDHALNMPFPDDQEEAKWYADKPALIAKDYPNDKPVLLQAMAAYEEIKKILHNKAVTTKEIQGKLGLERRKTKQIMETLENMGYLAREVIEKRIYWTLIDGVRVTD